MPNLQTANATADRKLGLRTVRADQPVDMEPVVVNAYTTSEGEKRVSVKTPYHREAIYVFRNLDGWWDKLARKWRFAGEKEREVRAALIDLFGTDSGVPTVGELDTRRTTRGGHEKFSDYESGIIKTIMQMPEGRRRMLIEEVSSRI